jgi:hypothetical protein
MKTCRSLNADSPSIEFDYSVSTIVFKTGDSCMQDLCLVERQRLPHKALFCIYASRLSHIVDTVYPTFYLLPNKIVTNVRRSYAEKHPLFCLAHNIGSVYINLEPVDVFADRAWISRQQGGRYAQLDAQIT